MENENTRDPEKFLKKIAESEMSEQKFGKRGKLKVFLGYCAGVGKTYRMLQEAALSKKNGRDVVIGVIETHKREETAELSVGFEKVCLNTKKYHGLDLEEMDADGILARKPELALVDELAHTNVPGSRHEKRYQDVEEILNSGINVFTTLNIQHIDSLNDVVYQFTGIKVNEVVPDDILINADEIELVDLTPEKLLERLKEGKVYIADRAKVAMEKFFRKDNLTSLRELSLNYTAKRIEERTRTNNNDGMRFPWFVGSRLLVAVSASQTSEKLIRVAGRIAGDLNAEWHAVYVETFSNEKMSGKAAEQLNKNLNLAEEFGARVVRLSFGAVTDRVIKYSIDNHIDMIIVGASRRSRLEEIFKGSVLNELVRKGGSRNILVVGENFKKPGKKDFKFYSGRKQTLRPYLISLLSITITAGFGWLLRNWMDPVSIGMMLLLPVIVAGIVGGVRVGMFSSVVAALSYDFFFLPPFLTFRISDIRYLPSFIVFIAVSVTISYLAKIIRSQAEGYHFKDRFISAINSFSTELLTADTKREVLYKAARKMKNAFDSEIVILLSEKNGTLRSWSNTEKSEELSEKDKAIAVWVYMNDEEAGRKTKTLSSSKWYFVPITIKDTAIGVVGIKTHSEAKDLTQEQKTLLELFLNLIAIALTNLKTE